jgi:hypothetical protein
VIPRLLDEKSAMKLDRGVASRSTSSAFLDTTLPQSDWMSGRERFRYPAAPMDRQSTFLLALSLLIAAAAFVSASGWILFARDRRASRVVADHHAEVHPEG